jgi:hypothetical protein
LDRLHFLEPSNPEGGSTPLLPQNRRPQVPDVSSPLATPRDVAFVETRRHARTTAPSPSPRSQVGSIPPWHKSARWSSRSTLTPLASTPISAPMPLGTSGPPHIGKALILPREDTQHAKAIRAIGRLCPLPLGDCTWVVLIFGLGASWSVSESASAAMMESLSSAMPGAVVVRASGKNMVSGVASARTTSWHRLSSDAIQCQPHLSATTRCDLT